MVAQIADESVKLSQEKLFQEQIQKIMSNELTGESQEFTIDILNEKAKQILDVLKSPTAIPLPASLIKKPQIKLDKSLGSSNVRQSSQPYILEEVKAAQDQPIMKNGNSVFTVDL